MIFTDVAGSLTVDRHPSGIYRAAASMRQTKALASHFFVIQGSNHKHPKCLGRQCNHGHCLSRNFFLPKRVIHPTPLESYYFTDLVLRQALVIGGIWNFIQFVFLPFICWLISLFSLSFVPIFTCFISPTQHKFNLK